MSKKERREADAPPMAFPIKLVDLRPRFLRWEERVETYQRHKDDGSLSGTNHFCTDDCYETVTGPRAYWPWAESLKDAMGVEFLCPVCSIANKGAVGTHAVICWSRSRGVPDAARPGPGRWKMDGTDFGDLTLNADPPGTARSVKLEGGCGWHGHVTSGLVT